MKLALVTTTINIPAALAAYRAIDADVFFIVIGDRKTDDAAVVEFLSGIPNHAYYGADWQRKLYPRLSDLIGFNCIQRRNIGILEAVKHGAEIIWLWDDDNLALESNHFAYLDQAFGTPFNGVAVSSETGWFDPGSLLLPQVKHRGIPMGVQATQPVLHSLANASIGVSVGLWLGDGDVNAYDRIGHPPAIHSTTDMAKVGVVIAPFTNTVFNAQNVAFRRKLAPSMFQIPHIGRADDIFASLITQHVMREMNLHVRIGPPFTACWQNRSKASLLQDMREELFLWEHVEAFADFLQKNPTNGRSQMAFLRWLYNELGSCVWFPKQGAEAALVWCDEMEKVL